PALDRSTPSAGRRHAQRWTDRCPALDGGMPSAGPIDAQTWAPGPPGLDPKGPALDPGGPGSALGRRGSGSPLERRTEDIAAPAEHDRMERVLDHLRGDAEDIQRR